MKKFLDKFYRMLDIRIGKSKKGILATILFVVIIANYSFAANTIPINEQTAINALKGNIVFSLNELKEQRYFKANYLKHLGHDLDTIVVGSSYMLSLSSEDVNNNNFANLSVGAANLQDRLNILGLLENYGIKYKHIIIELDLRSFFDGDAFTVTDGNKEFNVYGDYFTKLINGSIFAIKPHTDFNAVYVNEYEAFIPLMQQVYTMDNLDPRSYYYRPDASLIKANAALLFDEEYKQRSRDTIAAADEPLKNVHISEKSKELVSKMSEYFHKKGIDVTFVIAPRSNYCYDKAGLKNFDITKEITEFLMSLTQKYGWTFRGSFSPYELGMTEDDFDDGFHLYEAAVKRLVNGE